MLPIAKIPRKLDFNLLLISDEVNAEDYMSS